jgi:hypothetical protein
MAHFTDNDRFDNDDDIPSAGKGKRGFPGWAFVLLCAVPIVAVVVIGGAFAFFTSQRAGDVRVADGQVRHIEMRTPSVGVASRDGKMIGPAGNANDGTKKVYARDEFKELVMGKSFEELIAAVGQPDQSVDSGFGLTYHYLNRTKDPATDKIDPSVELWFENGKVVKVNY